MKHGETPTLWRWLIVAAVVSFVPSLFFPYVGEEGVYTLTTLEMWHGHLWSNPVLYGNPYGRPPFLNWLMLPFAMAFGPAHVLVASRLVTALATVCTGAALFAFTRRIGGTRRAAWLGLLVFFSSDALLYHGWLAYSDPLFALLTFGAMASVMVAARRKTVAPLAAAMVLMTLAFLTKALTAYIFVFATLAVVFVRHPDARSTLLKPAALLCYLAGIAAPLMWFHVSGSTSAAGHEGGMMAADILNRMWPDGGRGWIKQICTFPIETFCRFLPVSAIVGYGLLRGKAGSAGDTRSWETTAAITVLLNFTPYWLSPQGSIRYILPLYPFIAFVLASRLATLTEGTIRAAVCCAAAVVCLKFVALAVFPVIQARQHGDPAAVARDIVAITGTDRIYTDDPSSAGLSVASNIDGQRWPVAPLGWIPAELPDGWLFTRISDRPGTAVVWTGNLGNEKMYLLCSKRACETAAARANRPLIVDAATRQANGAAH